MSTDLHGHFGVYLTQVTAIHTISILVLIWAHFSGISGVFLARLGALKSWQHREHRGDLKNRGRSAVIQAWREGHRNNTWQEYRSLRKVIEGIMRSADQGQSIWNPGFVMSHQL